MTEEQRKKKHELLTKISGLVQMASALGDAIDDEQTTFIAEAMKMVLIAGSDPLTSVRFSNHMVNYLNEEMLLSGELSVKDHLTKNEKFELN